MLKTFPSKKVRVFFGVTDITCNRCFPHFLALEMHTVRGSGVKSNSGGTESALGNPHKKELAQAESRHPWLTIQLFKNYGCFVLFLFWSSKPSIC